MEEVFKGASLEARSINPNVKDKASLEIARELHEFGRDAKTLDGELVEVRADELVARYVGHTANLVHATWQRAREGPAEPPVSSAKNTMGFA